MRRRRAALFVLLCVAIVAPRALGEPSPSAPAAFMEGRVVPADAVELCAVRNVFKASGWTSYGSSIQLVELTPEGEAVEQGQVVARFKFSGDEAKPWAERTVRQTVSERNRDIEELRRELRALEYGHAGLAVQARKAAVETERAPAVSRRDARLLEIDARIATFEVEAQAQRVDVQRRWLRASTRYHDARVAQSESVLERVERYRRRFELRAPKAGTVSHAYLPGLRRKVRRGDGLPVGTHIVSIAPDTAALVEFLVPERHYGDLKAGLALTVQTVLGDRSAVATLVRWKSFPQELGAVRQDDRLPNGREKVFVAYAAFEGSPEGLPPGTEVRVRLRPGGTP